MFCRVKAERGTAVWTRFPCSASSRRSRSSQSFNIHRAINWSIKTLIFFFEASLRADEEAQRERGKHWNWSWGS